MTEKVFNEKLFIDSRKLSLAIYGFLLNERSKKHHDDRAKLYITKAADCMKKVFKFRFADHANVKMMRPLQDIFEIAQHPVPIKNRIAAESRKHRGDNFLEAKMYKLAEVEYTEAIHLYPQNAVYYCNRAAARIGEHLFVEAVKDCNKALELDKNYVKPYCWLGLAYILMGNPALSIRYYRKAFTLEPNNPACIANMNLLKEKLDHESFKVFKPLFGYSQSMVSITTNNQALYAKKCGGDHIQSGAINKSIREKCETDKSKDELLLINIT